MFRAGKVHNQDVTISYRFREEVDEYVEENVKTEPEQVNYLQLVLEAVKGHGGKATVQGKVNYIFIFLLL
jgi:hypothetical protein